MRTLKIVTATRPFLGLSDRQHGTFLTSTGQHSLFLISTRQHSPFLNDFLKSTCDMEPQPSSMTTRPYGLRIDNGSSGGGLHLGTYNIFVALIGISSHTAVFIGKRKTT